MDSGCSNHITTNLEDFTSLDKSVTSKVKMGDGTIVEAHGKGNIKLNSCEMNNIYHVLYVPKLDTNLLSVGQFLEEGYCLVFKDLSCYVYKDKTKQHLLVHVPMAKNKIFPLNIAGEKQALKASFVDDNWLWHHRYGHLNFRSLKFLGENNLVDGLPLIQHVDALCESCVFGKHHRNVFPKGEARRPSKQIELVHTDVCGPMRTPSLNNIKYFNCICG